MPGATGNEPDQSDKPMDMTSVHDDIREVVTFHLIDRACAFKTHSIFEANNAPVNANSFNFVSWRIIHTFDPIYVFLKTRPNPGFSNFIQR